MRPEEINILCGCEESQAVCKAFRARGFNAFSCDTQECSGGHPDWHIQGDVFEAIKSRKWDAIIAFPPCTFLAKSSACRLYPKAGIIDEDRYKKGLKAKDFFMAILNSDCPFISIENPVSLKVFEMPKFSQEIEPYYFGHPFSKKTRLWLKGFPPLMPTNIVDKKGTYLPSHTSKNAYSGKNDKLTRDAKLASKTFSGIAEAMAQQWGDYLLKTL